jgi:hypothetical protein
MRPLAPMPEPYPRSGGLAAAGFYKLLGRPRLDPLTVLVRETAQNSWDARIPDRVVRYKIDGLTPIRSEAQECLRATVFPGASITRTGLHDLLHSGRANGLVISDRGTHGLGGPVSADEVSPDGTYDWVDLVLNVGKPNTHGLTGGTYGFGKTIAYIVSSVNAVVIHSRALVAGQPESRLIACAIGEEFNHDGRLHTGRHWWGRDQHGAPVPETGADADVLAAYIGMPPIADGELGTNILIVGPDFGGRTAPQAMRFLAESVTWHLWPKLMGRGPEAITPMEVAVTENGAVVPVPTSDERPPLQGFEQAFRALLDGVAEGRRNDGLERRVIRLLRPRMDLGDVITVPLVTRHRAEIDDGHDPADSDSPAPAAAITDACHHVALLRAPELVVDYVTGPAPTDGGSEWAAVFRCNDAVDGAFAAAEPPTHDSWRPELLEKGIDKTIVKVGLNRIHEFLAERWATIPDSGTRSVANSVATVADELSFLVRAAPSIGIGQAPHGRSGASVTKSARIEAVSTEAAYVDGRPGTIARVRLIPLNSSRGTRLLIKVGAALDESNSDPGLDPELSLVSVQYDEVVVPLAGTSASTTFAMTDPVELVVSAARSFDTTVLFEFVPEAITA